MNKKHFLALGWVFCCFANAYCQDKEENFLILNPGGHKGQIRDLLVTADKKKIVTGSFDKTIKIWDIESGELEREILGEIGVGSEGMVYDIALSPDDKLLAAGGWFGSTTEKEPLGGIRIFDFKTGKLLYILEGHGNAIEDLKFVNGSTQLMSADAEGDLWLWDLATKKPIRKYHHHDAKITGDYYDEVKCIAVREKTFLTADQYGRIKKWSIDKLDTLVVDHYYETIQADWVDISPDGNYYAACADTFLTVYNNKFSPVAESSSEFAPYFTIFSPDSKKLLTGCRTSGEIHKLFVYGLQDTVWSDFATFSDFDNSVLAGAWIDNETFAIGGGSHDEIMIVKLGKQNEKPKLIRRMAGYGAELYAASLNDHVISFADKWTGNFGTSEFNKQFDLFNKQIAKPDPKLVKNRPITAKGNFKLQRYRVQDELNAGLNILKDNKVYDSVVLQYYNGARHNVFSFLNEKYFVSGQSYGILSAFDLKGNEVSRFVGHIGDVWGLSVTTDGKRMITANADRTFKIWPLEEVGKKKTAKDLPTVAEAWKTNGVYDFYSGLAKKLNVEKEITAPGIEAWEKIIKVFNDNGYSTNLLEGIIAEKTANYIYPIASVFISERGDWLIWDERGYFTGSKKATRYVGYHVNKGKYKEAKYYPFEQFDLKFNRPDIIMKELGIASAEMIRAYEYAYQKRLKKMGITEEQLSDDIHLPETVISGYTFNDQTEKLSLKISASDDKYNLDRINIYVDDVPVFGTAGVDISKNKTKTFSGEYILDMIPGKNKIQVSVLNEKGVESLKETFSVIDKKQQKPDLYIVSIGVSNYKDPSFNLNYAAKDADDIAHFFDKSEMYSKVLVNELTNEKVTRENVLKIKNEFLSKAKPNDVVIFFVAGHGVLNKNLDYYYAAYNMDFQNPENGGITYEELESLLDGIKPYRKLFFMDSCHSGELDKDDFIASANTPKKESGDVVFRNSGNVGAVAKEGIGLSQSTQLMQELFADLRRGSGATVISSAGGAEYAMESKEWKNGLFTFCLLSGMKNKDADFNKDGIIMLSELQQYVSGKVTEMSGGKQLPTSRRENLEFDYRVW
jgi:WD40 repeat protein